MRAKILTAVVVLALPFAAQPGAIAHENVAPTGVQDDRFPSEPLSERGKTATMNPKDHWTHTGVRLRQGDIVRVETSGNVVVVPGQPGVGPEGTTRAGVGNPRLPDRPAGALLGKIGDGGEPFFIGAREHTFRADRDGVLWLGVNDDYFDDNTGELRVRISAGDEGAVGTSGADRRAVGRDMGADPITDRDITVRATDEWTDTGVMVRVGDAVRLQATGSIRLSENRSDVANPNGSRNRAAANAPFPQRSAGALIARIGDGEPMYIGARQQVIRVQEDGTLWLGVNDDHFADNSGEFRVRISVRPGR